MMKKKRIVVILQARMGANRLPGKPLKKVLQKPLLSYQLERLRRCKKVDEIVVATTTSTQDGAIETLCAEEKIPCFRGSEHDVLDRYYRTALKYSADTIVRITGDCPVIDPMIVDRVIGYYQNHQPQCDYVSNSLQRTFPRGLDTEVFSFELLERAAHEAKHPEEREHVTPYFYKHPELFELGSVAQEIDQSDHRWTVDTVEDLDLITKIITTLYPVNPTFNKDDIIKLLEKHPDWKLINAHIMQKKLYQT